METIQTMGVRQRRYHETEFSHQMFVTKKRRGAQTVDSGEDGILRWVAKMVALLDKQKRWGKGER
jgi:hypothetical protein